MKRLLIFTTWQDGDKIDLSPESNLWYVRRYELYFDEITHVLLCGHFTQPEHKMGQSCYVSVGNGNHKLDLLLAPLRLFRFAKQYGAIAYSTDEQVWLWWLAFLIKLLLRAKIVLIPITYPEAMYKLTGRSLSRILPIWLERKFTAASYMTADKVVTCKNSGSYADWMEENAIIRKKLLVTETLAEAIPTVAFFEELDKARAHRVSSADGSNFKLIYIGRLHPEKAVEDVVRMMSHLKAQNVSAELTIIGDGADRNRLVDLTSELELDDRIQFLGWKTNGELPHYLVNADVFVSPSAGGSLREAALCGLPIVAYELDWVKGFLIDEETFLAVEPGDPKDFADKVLRLKQDTELRRRLMTNISKLGWSQWSDVGVDKAVEDIYDKIG